MIRTSYHGSEFGGAGTSHIVRGSNKPMFLSITLLLSRRCNIETDFGMVGQGKVCRSAPAFNMIQFCLYASMRRHHRMLNLKIRPNLFS